MSAESPTGNAPISQEGEERDEGTAAFIAEAAKKAAAETPGIDPDAIVAKVMESLTPQLNSMLDKRVSGFQQRLDEAHRVNEEQASKLREFEVAGLSEDERAQRAQQERDEEVERLRLENELFRLKDKFPAGAEAYRRLVFENEMTAEQQVALLNELLTKQPEGAAAPAQPAQPSQQAPVLSDRNNPQRTLAPDAEVTEDGQVMSEEIAMATLRSTPRWPGAEE